MGTIAHYPKFITWRYRTHDDAATIDHLLTIAGYMTKTKQASISTKADGEGSWRIYANTSAKEIEIGSLVVAGEVVTITLPVFIEPIACSEALRQWQLWLEEHGLTLVESPHESKLPPKRFTLNTTPQVFEEWLRRNVPIPSLAYTVGSLIKRLNLNWRRKGRVLAVEQFYSQIGEDGVEQIMPAPVVFTAWLTEKDEPAKSWQAHIPAEPWLCTTAAELVIDEIGGGRIAVIAKCQEGLLDAWFSSMLSLIAETYPEAANAIHPTEQKTPAVVKTNADDPKEQTASTANRLPSGANLDEDYNVAYQREQELVAQGKTPKEARRIALREYCARTGKDYGDKNVRDSYRAAMKLRERKKRS